MARARPGSSTPARASSARRSVPSTRRMAMKSSSALSLAGLVDRDHVRMVDRRGEARLPHEALTEPIPLVRRRGEDLERHPPPELLVARCVDDRQRSASENALDGVPAEACPRPQFRLHHHAPSFQLWASRRIRATPLLPPQAVALAALVRSRERITRITATTRSAKAIPIAPPRATAPQSRPLAAVAGAATGDRGMRRCGHGHRVPTEVRDPGAVGVLPGRRSRSQRGCTALP